MKTTINLSREDIEKIVLKHIKKERSFDNNEPIQLMWSGLDCTIVVGENPLPKGKNIFDAIVGDESGT